MAKQAKRVKFALKALVGLIVPVGLMAAPVAAQAQGFLCGANNPLTQNIRPKLQETDRKTDSKTIDRDRLERALAKADKQRKGRDGRAARNGGLKR